MAHASVPVAVHIIAAGKLRRYHGVPLWKQMLDLPTVAKNVRDIVLIKLGFLQSLYLLLRIRPDVVFAKGGFVCLPMGLAAKFLRIPVVIHDSDTRPGLTNKFLSKFAKKIATGSPLENYNYPADKSIYTGVPIDDAFHPFSKEEQTKAKHSIGIVDLDKPLVVITGGGLGAQSINRGVTAIAEKLLADGFSIYHVTGKKHIDEVQKRAVEHPDYHVVDFVYKDMAIVLGAADIVVSRGSATFLQELAALAKPVVIVAAAQLGDQLKNAEVYQKSNAAYVIDDRTITEGNTLYDALSTWRSDTKGATAMIERFHEFARPDAATDVAKLVLDVGKTD